MELIPALETNGVQDHGALLAILAGFLGSVPRIVFITEEFVRSSDMVLTVSLPALGTLEDGFPVTTDRTGFIDRYAQLPT